jgi:hypothetical protein
MLALLLFLSLFLIPVIQTVGPVRRKPPVEPLYTVRLGLHDRLLRLRPHLVAVGAVLLHGIWTGWASPVVQLAVLLAALGLVCLPVQYRLTPVGIDLNGLSFRPWSEFDGYTLSGRRIRLHGFGTLDLWIAHPHQPHVVAILPPRLHPTQLASPGRTDAALHIAASLLAPSLLATLTVGPDALASRLVTTASVAEPLAVHLTTLALHIGRGIQTIWTLFSALLGRAPIG